MSAVVISSRYLPVMSPSRQGERSLASYDIVAKVSVGDDKTFANTNFDDMGVAGYQLFGFGGRPEQRHVRQGQCDDCYLLIALSALLTKAYGARWLQEVTFLGQTTVKGDIDVALFCPPSASVNAHSGKPQVVIYTVAPTSPREAVVGHDQRGQKFVNHVTPHAPFWTQSDVYPWIVLLEKAYAAHRVRYGNGPGFTADPTRDCRSFGQAIGFGFGRDALSALLGPVTATFWTPPLPNPQPGGLTLAQELVAELRRGDPRLFGDLKGEIRRIAHTQLSVFQRLVGSCFPAPDNDVLMERFFEGQFPTAKQTQALSPGKDPARKMIRWEEIWAIVDPGPVSGMSKTLLGDVRAWLQSLFPGKRGTGIYTKSMLDVLEQIKSALADRNRMMFASAEVSRTGIQRRHGYAVVGLDKRGDVHFVKLMNPQADRNGRGYREDPVSGRLKPVPRTLTENQFATINGAFDVELGDFIKSFTLETAQR